LEGQAVVSAPLPKSAPHYRLFIRAAAVGESVTIARYPPRRWYVATARMIEIITSANLGGRIVTAPTIIFGPPDLPQVCEHVPKNRDTMLTAAGP